jgi:hypothetical protein
MNAEEPDKLFEGASAPEFLSGRHSSVRRREPADAKASAGKTAGDSTAFFWLLFLAGQEK